MIETQILGCVLLNWVSNDPRKGWEPGPVHRSFTDHNHPSLCLHSCPVLSDIWHLSHGTEHEKRGSNNRRLQLHGLSFSWISARNNNFELWAKTPIIREVITDRNNFCSTGTMMSPLLRRGTSVGTKKPFIISSRIGSEACRSPQNTPVIKNPGSEVLKELKGWINYNPALYYPTLEQNKKLYTKLYELPHIFFFWGLTQTWKEKQEGIWPLPNYSEYWL